MSPLGNHPIHIRQVDVDNLDDLQLYADAMRRGGEQEFGELGQRREAEDFAAQARLPGVDVRYFVAELDNNLLAAGEVNLSADTIPKGEIFLLVFSDFQGYGVGREFLSFLERLLANEGRSVAIGNSTARTRRENRAARFLQGQGYTCVGTTLRQDLSVNDIPDEASDVVGVPGIILTPHWGAVSPALMQDLARLSTLSRATWAGEDVPAVNPDSMEATMRTLAARTSVLTVTALDERSGHVVAYTTMQAGPKDALVEQYDTFVLPEYRRRGIGTGIKRLALRQFRQARPEARRFRTFAPSDADLMTHLNRGLGYADTGYYRSWEKELR